MEDSRIEHMGSVLHKLYGYNSFSYMSEVHPFKSSILPPFLPLFLPPSLPTFLPSLLLLILFPLKFTLTYDFTSNISVYNFLKSSLASKAHPWIVIFFTKCQSRVQEH